MRRPRRTTWPHPGTASRTSSCASSSVDQDPAQTVTVHRLSGDHYAVQASMPLALVLNTSPAEHDLG